MLPLSSALPLFSVALSNIETLASFVHSCDGPLEWFSPSAPCKTPEMRKIPRYSLPIVFDRKDAEHHL